MTVVAMMSQRPGYGPPTPVPIFQWEDEFEQLLGLYRERAPGRVLEIGTYYGGTLYHWLRNAAHDVTVVSVDSYAAGVDNRHLYPGWTPEGVDLEVVAGDSSDQDVIEYVATFVPFDWVWIDAGHYYHEVAMDWQSYGSMCAPGGVVVFHDILPPTVRHPEIEVSRLWQELKADGHETLEIIADPDADWGGIGVLFK